MRTSDNVLWSILKFFRLNKLYRHLLRGFFPESVNAWITNLATRNAYIPLVVAKEIMPKYTSAWRYLARTDSVLGDYLEFGVSYGTSMKCMHLVLHKLELDSVRLYGFDSFEGMPASAAIEDEGTWRPGQFARTMMSTRKYLSESGIDWRRTFLIRGWFNITLSRETIAEYKIKKASVIMVDCNIYSSSKLALNFCTSLIHHQAIIFFNDWRNDTDFGECRAYSEFLIENPRFRSEAVGRYKPHGKVFLLTETTIG